MPDSPLPAPPRKPVSRPIITEIKKGSLPGSDADKMTCERCGAEMYRMHAVWRCSGCGFKTDCCGW
jgi:ribosomal protein L37AE/L43A